VIDNEKVKKSYFENDRVNYLPEETEFANKVEPNGNFGSIIHAKGFYIGYAARDKEAEEDKRELIDALLVSATLLKDAGIEPILANELLEKHTDKPIDEVIK